jgi:hypothetical protein
LFGLNAGTVKNLTIESGSITSTSNGQTDGTGAFAGTNSARFSTVPTLLPYPACQRWRHYGNALRCVINTQNGGAVTVAGGYCGGIAGTAAGTSVAVCFIRNC